MILVTGGTGFLGSYILRELIQQGQSVKAIRRANSSMQLVNDIADQIEWVEADIMDVPALTDAMQGIKQVYHAAAMVSFEPDQRYQLLHVNVQGTANVVNAALEAGVEKLAYISSIAALGRNADNDKLINELTMWEDNPANTGYAISKMLGEREVWRGVAEGLNAVVVNPGMILGSGDWNSGTAAFFNTIKNGLKYYTNGMNGFVGVDDVAKITVQLMQSEIVNERYVLVEGNYSYKQLFEWISESIQAKAPYIEAKPWMSELVWRAAALRRRLTGKPSVITKETAANAALVCKYDNSKIKQALDFQFTPIKEVVAQTGKAYLAR